MSTIWVKVWIVEHPMMRGGHKTCVFCDQGNWRTGISDDKDKNDKSYILNKVLMGSWANKKVGKWNSKWSTLSLKRILCKSLPTVWRSEKQWEGTVFICILFVVFFFTGSMPVQGSKVFFYKLGYFEVKIWGYLN